MSGLQQRSTSTFGRISHLRGGINHKECDRESWTHTLGRFLSMTILNKGVSKSEHVCNISTSLNYFMHIYDNKPAERHSQEDGALYLHAEKLRCTLITGPPLRVHRSVHVEQTHHRGDIWSGSRFNPTSLFFSLPRFCPPSLLNNGTRATWRMALYWK